MAPWKNANDSVPSVKSHIQRGALAVLTVI